MLISKTPPSQPSSESNRLRNETVAAVAVIGIEGEVKSEPPPTDVGSAANAEFGAVSVVSGHIRGQTNTMPLQVEVLYNEYNFAAAFAVASLLAGLALVTLVVKTLLEWRHGDQLAAAGH